MKTLIYISIFSIFISLVSCKQKEEKVWSELPEITALDSLKKTDFVITLENPISENKNIIYAPAFKFAWDEIENLIMSPIELKNTNSEDFKFLLKSNSHKNSLNKSEYESSAELFDGQIIAKAFFNKTLPFETKLHVLEEPILFDKTKVTAFGMKYFDHDIINFTKILYYQNDDNFILKISPKDKKHEIILVRGLNDFKTLKVALEQINNMIEKGEKEKLNQEQSWKYNLLHDDIFSIPTVKFNIETYYKNIQGQSFYTKDQQNYLIETAYQRTGFILNENGAVAESEAIVEVASEIEPCEIKPKKMVFDKPFLIILKRTDQTNPYFVMAVNNSELLTKK